MTRFSLRFMLLTIAVLTMAGAAGACTSRVDSSAPRAALAGDPERGRQVLRQYGCHTCHTIPGVRGANGRVGPPLDRLAERSYIGGVAMNTREQLTTWIQNPRALSAATAMPVLDVTDDDARDMVAYLHTLR